MIASAVATLKVKVSTASRQSEMGAGYHQCMLIECRGDDVFAVATVMVTVSTAPSESELGGICA